MLKYLYLIEEFNCLYVLQTGIISYIPLVLMTKIKNKKGTVHQNVFTCKMLVGLSLGISS